MERAAGEAAQIAPAVLARIESPQERDLGNVHNIEAPARPAAGAHRRTLCVASLGGTAWKIGEKPAQLIEMSGAPDTIRTCGLRLRRAALYPAELRVQADAGSDFIVHGGPDGNRQRRRVHSTRRLGAQDPQAGRERSIALPAPRMRRTIWRRPDIRARRSRGASATPCGIAGKTRPQPILANLRHGRRAK